MCINRFYCIIIKILNSIWCRGMLFFRQWAASIVKLARACMETAKKGIARSRRRRRRKNFVARNEAPSVVNMRARDILFFPLFLFQAF